MTALAEAPGASLADKAIAHFHAGRFDLSETLCHQILLAEPRHKQALNMLGVIAQQSGRLDESIEFLTRAVEAYPANARLSFALANSLRKAGSIDRALECYRNSTASDPNLQEAHTNFAATLQQLDRYEESLPVNRRAAQLNPDCKIAQFNLGHAYTALGMPHLAVEAYGRAVEIDPHYAEAQWNLGVCRLLNGDFERGWQGFEWRVAAAEVHHDRYPYARWQGEELADKTILVHPEQGIGDEILFASCLQDLIARARRCIVVCEPRLSGLFARSFPLVRVIPWQRRKDFSPCPIDEPVDFQVPIGSLPLAFRQAASYFPATSYLRPHPALCQEWRRRYAKIGSGLKVGLSWQAGGKPSESQKRTIPLVRWANILRTAGAQFVNLQYGDSTVELQEVQRRLGIQVHDWEDSDPLVDMDSFAAKVAELDLVISVGNATAHLAGALGKEAWVLLPLAPSWRWQQSGRRCIWYPHVDLYRQADRHRWDDVLTELATRLRARTCSGNDLITIHADEHPEPDAQPNLPVTVQSSKNPTDETLAAWLKAAANEHQSGRLAEAERLYRQILRVSPRHLEATHLVGVLCRQAGRADAAVRYLKRAIDIKPSAAPLHYHLGLALLDLGRNAEAISCQLQAIKLAPDLAKAQVALGQALANSGDHDSAVEILRQALRRDPTHPESLVQLAKSLYRSCRQQEAFGLLEQVIGGQPICVAALSTLGGFLLEERRWQEAATAFARAIELDPQDVRLWINSGTAHDELGEWNEALARYERALALDPERFDTLVNLAGTLKRLGQTSRAIAYFRAALRKRPRCAETLNQLGKALEEIGRVDEAIAAFESALEIWPDYPNVRANRALAFLHVGRLAEGWREYEWRWKCESGGLPRARLPQPAWDGSSLSGKTILIHGEQGVGVEIMFASCYPDVVDRAEHTVIAADPRLVPIFARSFPRATFVPVVRGTEHQWTGPREPRIDCQIAAGSIPRFCRNRLEDFPQRPAYLVPHAAKLARWKTRLGELGQGTKIGFAWRGGTNSTDRRLRWTTLETWLPLLHAPRVHWISLQYDDCSQELADFRRVSPVPIHRYDDFDPTQELDTLAAQIAALDLVISVGNAGVHMAGALGMPAWCLLPRFHGWRWMLGRTCTPWYPSVRLYRQDDDGWPGLFKEVGKDLVRWLAGTRRPT